MVISQRGICATSNPLASQAGAKILEQGGSAADAAIAANAVLGVVEPMMNGMGGDLFALYWEANTGKLTGLNASGPAPLALNPDFLATRGVTSMAEIVSKDGGIHAVTLPGAVDGWAKMHAKFGRLPWAEVLRAAIAYSDDGFPVSEIVHELWAAPATVAKLQAIGESARVFLPGGRVPEQGEVFRNPDLAKAYGIVAREGTQAFYQGAIAEAILKTSGLLGGRMKAKDLASYSAEWVEPISIDYRGWRVYELPPNGQGIAALEMLNIIEVLGEAFGEVLGDGAPGRAGGGPLDAAEIHKRIESMKLAYADAYRYNADPRMAQVPLETLLSKEHARQRAALVNPQKANGDVPAAQISRSDTVYLAVVDREGNIASWIQSVFAGFGSGITVDGMGFVLQNRGAGFSLDPKHPNVLAGGKRPYHTIIPGFMERGDQHVGFGIMGGANQPLAHAQFVSNVVDYGMNLQQAVEAPRFFKGESSGCNVAIEARVPEAAIAELSAMGHVVSVRPEYSQEMGRGQAVMHRSDTKVNYGASDARSDGAATPEGI